MLANIQPGHAQSKEYNVPAQSATTGIPEFARQAGIQILVAESLVRGKGVSAVTGSHSVEEALSILLEGTGLSATSKDGTTYTLVATRATNTLLNSAQKAGSPGLQSYATAGLEEVIVAAQKRLENVRDVPISVSVVGRREIADQHIKDVADITRVVPNFSFTTLGNPGSNNLEIRGVSSSAGASTVATYMDDVPITSPGGQPDPVLFDVQQIEVLRGPQGTLYGASAEGGLLKFRMNPVELHDFGASVSADVSDTQHGSGNYGATAVINVPIAAGIAGFRLGASSSYDSGYVNRYSPATGALVSPRVNDHHTNAVRLAVEIRPTDALSITPAVHYQRISYGSTDVLTLGLGGLATNNLVRDPGSDTMLVPSLTVHYDVGRTELTSVTADYTRSSPQIYDGTAYNSVFTGQLLDAMGIRDLQENLSGAVIGALPSPGSDTNFERHVSQELRLASRPDSESRLDWTVGLYYEKMTARHTDAEPIENFNEVFTSRYGVPTLDAVFGGPLPDNRTWFAATHIGQTQYSAFGDLTWHVTPALRLSAGTRVLYSSQDNSLTGYGFYFTYSPYQSAASKDHAVTPKVSATYELSNGISSYVTMSQGFRLGGPNFPVSTKFCAPDLERLGVTQSPPSYQHDQLWNYELGVKARPTNQLAIEGAVYYIKWDKLQQSFYLPTCGLGFTQNVGAARSYGTELSLTYRPFSQLALMASGGYTNAQLTQDVALAGIRAGEQVEGVPDYSGSASVEYRRPLNSDTAGFLRANYSYTGNSHGTLTPTDPDYRRPAYGVAGASVGVTVQSWEFSFYTKNLFNNQEIIQRPNRASVPTGFTLRPRTIGLSVSATF